MRGGGGNDNVTLTGSPILIYLGCTKFNGGEKLSVFTPLIGSALEILLSKLNTLGALDTYRNRINDKIQSKAMDR